MNQHQLAIEHRKLTTVQQRGLHKRANALGRPFLDQLAIELQEAETRPVPDEMENYVDTVLAKGAERPVQDVPPSVPSRSGNRANPKGAVGD